VSWRFYNAAGEEKQAAFPANADVSFAGYRATLLADPTSPQDAATKAYVDARAGAEGTSDFSATAGNYTALNAAWGSPGWYAPLVVGPNQTWEIIATAGLYCVTAAHVVFARLNLRDSAGAAIGPGYPFPRSPVIVNIPAVTGGTVSVSSLLAGRMATDGTVPPNTTIRLVQEFNGSGANGRVIRDGTYYQTWAWRRV
jgi:hypothetical protein